MHLPSHHFPSHTSFKGRPILTPHAHTLIESLSGDCLVASRCLLMFRQDWWSLHQDISLSCLSQHLSHTYAHPFLSISFSSSFPLVHHSHSSLSLSLSPSLPLSSVTPLLPFSISSSFYSRLSLSLTHAHAHRRRHTYIETDRQTDKHADT